MIKITKYIIPILCALAMWGCEVNVGSPIDNSTGQSECTLTALAVAGDSLKVRLAFTEKLTDQQFEKYEDMSVRLRMLMFPGEYPYLEDSIIMAKYRETLTKTQATVKAITGNGENIDLTFNNATLNYECGYRPQPGEKLTLTAAIPDSAHIGGALTAMSTINVPGWQPQAEIANTRRLYKERQQREDLPLTESLLFTDSVVEITLRIRDTSADTHCYRLKASGVAYNHALTDNGYDIEKGVMWSSAFFTDDPLLYDSQITDMFGPWQAYTTDVFSNRQFRNETYLTFQVRYPSVYSYRHRLIEIELQPITSALMNYLSVLYRMRVAKQSYYSDYTTLPSNIDGGVGIFGGIGKSTKLRIWLDGDPDPDYPE